MDAQTRQYLDEDWDETELEEPQREQQDKRPPNPTVQDRQQKQKAWGKAIAKHQRAVQKDRGKQGKP